jgi:hypothetical protein
MLLYSKGSFGHSITIHYNGNLDASKQAYSKGSLGPSLTVHFNGYLEAYKQG